MNTENKNTRKATAKDAPKTLTDTQRETLAYVKTHRFIALDSGTSSFKECEELVRRGLMTRRVASSMMAGNYLYYITAEGRKALEGGEV